MSEFIPYSENSGLFNPESIINLECYEPNSGRVCMDARDLCQHTLIVGSTGSGKTTGLMLPMIRNLIEYKASDPVHKLGLVIYDCKGDRTAEIVRELAKRVGREADVMEIGENATHSLDFLSEGESLRDLMNRITLLIDDRPDDKNPFFEENRKAMMKAMLMLYCLARRQRSLSQALDFCSRYIQGSAQAWNLSPESGTPFHESTTYLDVARYFAARLQQLQDPLLRTALSGITDTLDSWEKTEERTMSNCRAGIRNNIENMRSRLLLNTLDNPRLPRISIDDLSKNGVILVVNLPGLSFPADTRVAGGLIKALMMDAMVKREEQIRAPDQRYIGLIMDEYPLITTGSHARMGDARQLQVIRSKGAFAIAATQGFSNLVNEIGINVLQSILVNFGNHFFLKTTEPGVEAFANQILGPRLARAQPEENDTSWKTDYAPHSPRIIATSIIPPGALATLETHCAFIKLHNQFRTFLPHHFVPLFDTRHNVMLPPASPRRDDPESLSDATLFSIKDVRKIFFNIDEDSDSSEPVWDPISMLCPIELDCLPQPETDPFLNWEQYLRPDATPPNNTCDDSDDGLF